MMVGHCYERDLVYVSLVRGVMISMLIYIAAMLVLRKADKARSTSLASDPLSASLSCP